MDYALLVGINAYSYPNELRGCLNDVADVGNELQNALGFSPDNITSITDQDATASNIKNALSAAVSTLQPGDRFLFWYSGHGAQLVQGDAATDVICPVDFNFSPETCITVDDFHGMFSNIPDGVTAAWGSDSCHSGDLERDFYRAGVPRQFYGPKNIQPKAKQVRGFRDISASLPNIALLSGCRSDQTSADADIDGRYNGAFTYYLLKQLRDPNGLITPLTDLLPEVQSALQDAGYAQIPQLGGPPDLAARPFLQG